MRSGQSQDNTMASSALDDKENLMSHAQNEMTQLLTAEIKATHLLETEYQLLSKQIHLSGIVVLPHLESIRVWDGVLFIREGIYSGGIFKFRINFP